MQQTAGDRLLWRRTVTGLRREWEELPPGEREWITLRLATLAALQERLHAVFLGAGGAALCSGCRGGCCGEGRYHLTLVNLLGYWAAGRTLPEPDFARDCPFLGDGGCRLAPACRPFNCVTFACDRIDERFSPAERQGFYALERQMREIYEDFDGRYAGSSLRGLLLRAERIGAGRFLARV